MLLRNFVLTDEIGNFHYAEFPDDPERGSFLFVDQDDKKVTVQVDRFSTLPFYYAVHDKRLYGATRIADLLSILPSDYQRKLDVLSAIEFLRTNCMIGEKTFLEGIRRVPFGHQLVFSKVTGKVELQEYWRLPGILLDHTEGKWLKLLRHGFLQSVRDASAGAEKIGIHLSGGMDSRQLLGALLSEGRKFDCFTYGVPDSLDVKVAHNLARHLSLNHHYLPWDGLKGYRQNWQTHFNLTEGMQSFFHGHGIELYPVEAGLVDRVLHGHFIDFFLQAHRYSERFEGNSGPLVEKLLYETFDGGVCSTMRGDSCEHLVFGASWRGAFRESILQEIRRFDYLPPEKRYDAIYFIHHGLRRLLPQVQAGACYVDYRLPGLHRDFFELTWAVPGRIRRDRHLQQKLLSLLYPKMMEIPLVKDNVQLLYAGHNPLRRASFKIAEHLRARHWLGFHPHYNYYAKGLLEMANRDLYAWMRSDIYAFGLENFGFIRAEFLSHAFQGRAFDPLIGLSFYGSLYTLMQFMKVYGVKPG